MLIDVTEHRKTAITGAKDIGILCNNILWREEMFDRDKEHFWAIGLNQGNCIRYVDLISLGSNSASVVHPRETFRRAIAAGINNLIFVHNHPSGRILASKEDKMVCKKLVMAGDIIGINVLDFMIIGNTEDREAEVPLFSFANAGCLRNGVTK